MSRWANIVGLLGTAMLIAGLVILVRDARTFAGTLDWFVAPALCFGGAVLVVWWGLERILGMAPAPEPKSEAESSEQRPAA